MIEIEVDNGKYQFVAKDGRIEILRFGEKWVDLNEGGKAIIALLAETERLTKTLACEIGDASGAPGTWAWHAEHKEWRRDLGKHGDSYLSVWRNDETGDAPSQCEWKRTDNGYDNEDYGGYAPTMLAAMTAADDGVQE